MIDKLHTDANTPAKVGAPEGNTNRALHGLYGTGWPKGCERQRRQNLAFMRALRSLIVDRDGESNVVAEMAIDAAGKWDRHGRLAARWLRLEGDAMEPAERLNFSREVARAATERNKAVKELRLDDRESDLDAFRRELQSGAMDADSEPASVRQASPNRSESK